MLNKPFCTISILSLKSSHSFNRSLQKCKLNWSKIQEFSVISKNPLTTFLMNVNVASQMNLSLTCTAEFIPQTELLSATKVMWKRCISLDKVLLKYLTMKMTILLSKRMKKEKLNQFSIFLNIVILVTIKYCSISNQTLFSKHWITFQMRKTVILASKIIIFQISFSCVSRKTCFSNYVIFSLRQLRILRDVHSKEERDSCNRKIPAQRDMMIKLRTKSTQVTKTNWLMISSNIIVRKMRLKSSILMKNQRVRLVKKKIWSIIWINSMVESMFLSKHLKKLMAWSPNKRINKQ